MNIKKTFYNKHVIVASLCGLLLMVGQVRAEGPVINRTVLNEPASTTTSSLEELVAKSSPQDPKHGFASYYASRFIGRKTTSGIRYHPDKMTAAHYSLPLGTQVRVVNPVTSQEVQVTITDRCARKPFHFIDLSRAAAKKIGLWGKGKIKVVIIPLMEDQQESPA